MKRDISVERLFPLGDFKNIKFGSTLTEIPEPIATNEQAIGQLYYVMALGCDLAYRKYFDTIDKITKEKIQDVRGYLEKERLEAMKELQDQITKIHVTEKETE